MALTRIQTDAIKDAITSSNIADGTIQTVDLSNGAITQPKLASGAVENYMAASGANFMFRNKIINGDMRIDQRYSGTATSSSLTGYTVDRWMLIQSTSGKLVVQRNANTITPPAGFVYYLGVTSQASYTVAQADRYMLQQAIEGANLIELGWGTPSAKPVTLSFWVRSSITGLWGANATTTPGRSYPFTYTINVANTWEYKTVTIPADTVAFTTDTTSFGIAIRFGLGAGSNNTGAADTWQGGYLTQAVNTNSLVSAAGATWYITGVQLETGSIATPFEHRLYGMEYDLCRRYCQAFGNPNETQRIGWGGFNSATSFDAQVQLSPPMRVRPNSMTVINAGRVLDFGVNWDLVTVATLGGECSPTVALVSLTTTGSTAAQGDVGLWGGIATNRVQVYFEAEL